jgi:uncharacterized protein YjbJ (UPF0337 family)
MCANDTPGARVAAMLPRERSTLRLVRRDDSRRALQREKSAMARPVHCIRAAAQIAANGGAASSKGVTRMNKDQMDGTWDSIKGKAKRIWGELTEDDFLRAEGSVDKLFGAIEKRFGDTKEQIKSKIDHLHIK